MRILFIIVASAFIFCTGFSSATCMPLTSTFLQKLSEAVSARFDLAPDLLIEDQGTVNDGCYRRVIIHSREPKRLFSLFISPDQRFVAPDVIDLSLSRSGELLREKSEISALLTAGQSPMAGPKQAAVTLVEFADFQCPFCKRLAEYIARARKDGVQMITVYKQSPLPEHSWARQAALLSSCAAAQGNEKFWLVHDFFFSNQESLSPETIEARTETYLNSLHSADVTVLRSCLSHGQGQAMLKEDESLAETFHIRETPTVFINGFRVRGFSNYSEFTDAIKVAQRAAVSPIASVYISSGTPILR